MNAKLFTTTILTVGLLGLAGTSPVHATDFKMYAGSGCKVFGSTAWTDLQFSAAGVINLTTTPKNVICPLIKDSEGLYDSSATTPVNAANVHVHIKSGAATSRTICNIYVIDFATGFGLVDTNTIDTGGMAANTEFSGDSGALDGGGFGDHTDVMMLCTLGSKAGLKAYSLSEQGPTQ